MSGEEVFCRGLFEFRTGVNQFIIANEIFGLYQPNQSFAFTFFLEHIYENFIDLVTDNLDWWYRKGWLHKSKDAITSKMAHLGYTFDDPMDQTVGLFIDCNCLETSVVMHGPARPGENAPRWDAAISEAFYNGWKSMNGLKHQTCDTAQGMTADMYGPLSLRRNDLRLLAESQILPRLNTLNDELVNELNEILLSIISIFGDSAYPDIAQLLRSYFRAAGGVPLTERQKAGNYALKVCRESIEWNYGACAAKFEYLTCLDKLRLMSGTKVLRVYTVALILRNCMTCLYGNQTSNFFGLSTLDGGIPTLEQYLRQE